MSSLQSSPDGHPRTAGLRAPLPNSYVIPDTRLIAGEYPGHYKAEEARRRIAMLIDAGVTTFIDLTRHEDGLELYEPFVRSHRLGQSIECMRIPIPDMGVSDNGRMLRILNAIDSALETDQTVYVHCWGGVGRTGTVVGCWLVRRGLTGTQALAEVGRLFATMPKAKGSAFPEGSPQTQEQRNFVLRWESFERG